MKRALVYFLLLLVCAVTAWFVHHSSQDATWLSRQFYPVEAAISYGNYQCEGSEQQLLLSVLKAGKEQGSLRSNAAYLSPQGDITLCASAPRREQPKLSARYRYASLTKLLTAEALLRSAQNNQLDLDTRLSAFVTQANEAQDTRWTKVTVRQLLMHQAGLDRLKSYDPMTRHGVKAWCPNDLEQLKYFSLDFNPSEGFGYSNLSYCLLGVVLEKLHGTPYIEAITELLALDQFDMQFVEGPYLDDEVQYDFRHTGFYSEDYYRYLDFPALASSAGLSGTAQSLMQWIAEQRKTGGLLVLQDVWPEHCDISKKRACYGYAVFPYRQQGENLFVQVQQGYVFGASSSLVFDEFGGVLLWLGNGTAPKGNASDNMLDVMYQLLLRHYDE